MAGDSGLMLETYTLTFLLVGMLHGQMVELPRVRQDLTSVEHCMRVVQDVRRTLPRGMSIQRPVCSKHRRWWV